MMLWRRIVRASAIIFAVLVADLILIMNGFVLVVCSDLSARFVVGYEISGAVPLHKILWVSYGFPKQGGLLWSRCPDGRMERHYYMTSEENWPVHPVGDVC